MSVDKDKKPNRQNLPIEPIDPAVENALGDSDFYNKLKRARKMTEAEKKKRKKDKSRVRDTYDLPEWIITSVTMIAQFYDAPPSHIATHLLAAGIRAFLSQQINLYWSLETSRIPRYESFLKSPEEVNLEDLKRFLMELKNKVNEI
jgi:hypothetical protein